MVISQQQLMSRIRSSQNKQTNNNRKQKDFSYALILSFPAFLHLCKASQYLCFKITVYFTKSFGKLTKFQLVYIVIQQLLMYLSLLFLQNWMAFTSLRVDNFTITDSLLFTNTNSPSHQDNYAFCQVRIIYI